MAAVRAGFPITGRRADSHASARALNAEAAEQKLSVERGKHAAAVDDPGADRSARNAAKARREGWTRTPGPTHGQPLG